MRVACFIVLGALLTACGNSNKQPLDTPTSGSIRIAVDECLRPLAEAELEVHSVLYPKTTIQADYVSEAVAFNNLLNDSARVIFATRDLNDEERAIFKSQTITPTSVKIATDGIALIVNKKNADSTLTLPDFLKMIKGEKSNWSSGQAAQIVFDNEGSSTVRQLMEKAGLEKMTAKNIYAVKENAEVVKYVKEHPSSIGIIGVNWISDRDDSLSNSFLNDIRVVSLSATEGEEAFQPYQAYLADGSYPLTRNVYMISREARSGLGTGFISFVASDKGQRIVQKMGLMPATMPVRFVEIKSENINY